MVTCPGCGNEVIPYNDDEHAEYPGGLGLSGYMAVERDYTCLHCKLVMSLEDILIGSEHDDD